ncbi:MAG TPA: trypsin-like serine protease [Solirubrobacterales bacterium]|nr:trypsin-like serine protease [Solirubrobacterales bacterium]
MGAVLLFATTARALPHDPSLGAFGKQAEWQRLAPGLQENARQALSSAFAGVWIDNSDGGRIKLAIVDSSPALYAQVHGVIADSGLTGAVDVVQAARTERQLTQILNQLAARLAAANQGSSTPLTVGIRPDQNTVRVSSPNEAELTPPQQQLLSEASQRYGAAISFGVYRGKIRPEACSYPFCTPPLRAGVKIGPSSSFFGGSEEGSCTGGFLARGKEDGKLYQLTAGHCGGGTEIWGSRPGSSKEAWKEIGAWSKSSITEAGDFGMYQVSNNSLWQERPWVYWAGSNDEYPITSDANVVKGQKVCGSGAFYGTTSCGEVTEVSVVLESYYPGLGVKKVKLSRANFCAVPGDSGSPVHYNGVAYGILTGGSGQCNTYFSSVIAAEEVLKVDVIHAGTHYLLRNTNSAGSPDVAFEYGLSGDKAVVGDWNNDGTDTIGVYRPSNRTFYLRNSNSSGAADIAVDWGNFGDLPIVGDWNNDGTDTFGVYRPGSTAFYLRNSNSSGAADISAVFGANGDTPIVGDWNGDGTMTIGVVG